MDQVKLTLSQSELKKAEETYVNELASRYGERISKVKTYVIFTFLIDCLFHFLDKWSKALLIDGLKLE